MATLDLWSGTIRATNNRVIARYGRKHLELARNNIEFRDHPAWDKYYNVDFGRFTAKTGKITVSKERIPASIPYSKQFQDGNLKVPDGKLFDFGLGRLVKTRKLRAGETVKDGVIYKTRGFVSIEFHIYGEAPEGKRYEVIVDGIKLRRTENRTVRITIPKHLLSGFASSLKPDNFISSGSETIATLERIARDEDGDKIYFPQHSNWWLKVMNVSEFNKSEMVLRPEEILRGSYSVPQIIASPYTRVAMKIERNVFKIISDAPKCTKDDCMTRVVIKHYGNAFEKDNKTLTKEYMRKFINAKTEKLSIVDLMPFLKHHRLPFTALDGFQRIIYEWRPEDEGKSRNKHISNCHLFVMAVNEHIYDLNKNSWSIERKTFSKDEEEIKPPKPFAIAPTLSQLDKVADDIPSVLKLITKATDKTQIGYTGDLEDLFLYLREEHSYVPEISTKYGTLRSIHIYNGDSKINIVQSDKSVGDLVPWLNRFKKLMFKSMFKSYYSENLKRVFSECRKSQLVRRFMKYAPDMAECVDVRRHYTWAGCQIKQIPSFIWTDDFVKYDGHELEDYTLYMIVNDTKDVRNYIIADKLNSVVSGYVLKRCGLQFDIKSFCRPSSLTDNPFPTLVKELYSTNVPKDVKKFAPLYTIGSMGKMRDHNEKAVFTTSQNDAMNLTEMKNIYLSKRLNGFFACKRSEEVVFESGWYAFQFLVYDIARLKMLELYNMLSNKGKEVYGILTDAMYVNNVEDIQSNNGESYEDLGTIHCDGVKRVPYQMYEVHQNEDVVVVRPTVFEEVNKKGKRNVLISAHDAGAGKTYLSFEGYNKDDVLAVAPGGKQVARLKQEYGTSVMTCCKFVGECVFDDNETKETGRDVVVDKKTLYDFKYIILDELFQNPISEIAKILRVCAKLPAMIIANGDVFQNSNRETCTVPRDAYFDTVLPRFFPERITLEGCRRLKLEEDRQKARAIRNALKSGATINSVIKKYKLNTLNNMNEVFDCIRKHKITDHITFENATASVVNQMYQRVVSVGGSVVCKKFVKGLTRNEIYTVEGIEDKQFIIDGKKYFKDAFRLPFAQTCHAVQGETIEKEYIIYDVEHINANSNWFYTAITRCQYLDKVYIYTGASLGGAIDWNGKIRGYKEQDEKAGRNGFDLTVSSVKDLCAKANYCCTHCRGIVAMIYEAGDDDQWTLDRIDDGSAHSIGNVQLSHLSCNRALGFLAKK